METCVVVTLAWISEREAALPSELSWGSLKATILSLVQKNQQSAGWLFAAKVVVFSRTASRTSRITSLFFN
jgi:hypothetical protein